MENYAVKIYENDQERYESTIQSENIHEYETTLYYRDVEQYKIHVLTTDIHESLWDIISDIVSLNDPRDTMSASNVDLSCALYDSAEFDETGFSAIVGDIMIISKKE